MRSGVGDLCFNVKDLQKAVKSADAADRIRQNGEISYGTAFVQTLKCDWTYPKYVWKKEAQSERIRDESRGLYNKLYIHVCVCMRACVRAFFTPQPLLHLHRSVSGQQIENDLATLLVVFYEIPLERLIHVLISSPQLYCL